MKPGNSGLGVVFVKASVLVSSAIPFVGEVELVEHTRLLVAIPLGGIQLQHLRPSSIIKVLFIPTPFSARSEKTSRHLTASNKQ